MMPRRIVLDERRSLYGYAHSIHGGLREDRKRAICRTTLTTNSPCPRLKDLRTGTKRQVDVLLWSTRPYRWSDFSYQIKKVGLQLLKSTSKISKEVDVPFTISCTVPRGPVINAQI